MTINIIDTMPSSLQLSDPGQTTFEIIGGSCSFVRLISRSTSYSRVVADHSLKHVLFGAVYVLMGQNTRYVCTI